MPVPKVTVTYCMPVPKVTVTYSTINRPPAGRAR